MNLKNIVIGIFIAGLLLFIGIIVMILYSSKKDVSNQEPYSKCLFTPITIKRASTIRWRDKTLRFRPYTLVINENSNFNQPDLKSVKVFQPGETVTFFAAKSYYSIHVGTTYYLLGKTKLASGEVIEFEYAYYGGVPPF